MKDEMKRAAAIVDLASRIYVEARGKVSGDQSIKLAVKFFDSSDQFFAKVLHYIAEKEKEVPTEPQYTVKALEIEPTEPLPEVELEPAAV